MVAISIAAGVISLLVPALLRQVTIGEEANRLTAVEAVVSNDLEWFSKYAKIWKLKTGSYPMVGSQALTTTITKASSYNSEAAGSYEPSSENCSTGLATPLLTDAQQLSSLTPTNSTSPYLPPYPINITGSTIIQASSGNVSSLNVIRTLSAAGNKIQINYNIVDSSSIGLNFVRVASVLVEAAAWCDRLP